MVQIIPKPGYKRNFQVNLLDLSTSYFYPLIISFNPGETASWHFGELDFDISSRGAGAANPWNQNYLHFSKTGNGWNDWQPQEFNVYHYGCYDYSEITIGCVGCGTKTVQACVWLRGGLQYCVSTNYSIEIYPEGYTNTYGEVFSVGTNYYGGTNTNVSILWTPPGYSQSLTKTQIPVGGIFYSATHAAASSVASALGYGTWEQYNTSTDPYSWKRVS